MVGSLQGGTARTTMHRRNEAPIVLILLPYLVGFRRFQWPQSTGKETPPVTMMPLMLAYRPRARVGGRGGTEV